MIAGPMPRYATCCDVEVGRDLQLLHREVRERARAGRTVRQLALVRLRVGDEFAAASSPAREGGTTSTFGVPPTIATGVKSLTAS